MASKNLVPTAQATEADIRRSRDRVWEYRFVWFLLLSIAGLSGYFYLINGVDRQLTDEIVKKLRKEFPSHIITVDRAHLQAGHSITIDGIRIAKPTDQGLRDVVRISRLVCNGPLELVGLVQGQLPVQSVVADGVEVCLWPMTNGKFSIQELSSTKPIASTTPTIEVRSGMVRIGSETGRSDQEIICHDLRVQAGLDARVVDGKALPLVLKIDASVASSFFPEAKVQARVTQDKTSWIASGTVTKLDYSQRLYSQLPAVLQQYLVHAAGFSGQINVAFAARNEQGKLSFESNSSISNGRLMHPQVPYPIEALSGDVFCDNGLLQLRNFSASSGSARIQFACDMHGLSLGVPITATMNITDLALDQRLYQALPQAMQETWRKLGISGVVDANANLVFDGKRWVPHVVVHAKNGGVEPDFFPYPLRQIQGDFIYQNDTVVARDLTAMAGDQMLSGALTLQKASPRWLMDLAIAADGPVAIDDSLLRALSPRDMPQTGLHKFVLSLHPTGTVHLKRGRFVRSADRPDTVSRSLELTFSECSVKYDGFRYPIIDVHGQATVDNDRLILREFVGRNDGGRIRGEGVCQSQNANLESMDLSFEAFDVALDEELQHALPQSVRGLWDQLQPSGVMDRVAVQIKRNHASEPLDMRVEMSEVRNLESQVGRAVSFRPTSIPYSINEVACDIVYRPGRIDIRSLSGLHDSSRLQAEGQIRVHSDGTWLGLLTWLPSTRFLVDQSLLTCLPSYLRDPLLRVEFRGPVSITGTTRISSPPSPEESIVREWDLQLEVEDGRLGGGGIASGIRGSIALTGENTPVGPMAYGTMQLDALSVKNVAVTGVQGPFAFDRKELLFGRDAAAWQLKYNVRGSGSSNSLEIHDENVVSASYRTVFHELRSHLPARPSSIQQDPNRINPSPLPTDPNQQRQDSAIPSLDIRDDDIRARTLSGTMFISGVEPLDGQRAKYRMRLVDADFHGFLVDLGETNTQASGRLSVQCDVQGTLTNLSSLDGRGQAWLRQANLYELPVMIRLFRLLSVRPDQGAFDSADIKFGIDGDRVPIQELTLDGDFVSMRGSGWVNLRRELDLDLFVAVGRRGLVGQILRPFAQHNSTSLIQIEVSGTTTAPEMKRSMPLINSLEQVLPETAKQLPNN